MNDVAISQKTVTLHNEIASLRSQRRLRKKDNSIPSSRVTQERDDLSKHSNSHN